MVRPFAGIFHRTHLHLLPLWPSHSTSLPHLSPTSGRVCVCVCERDFVCVRSKNNDCIDQRRPQWVVLFRQGWEKTGGREGEEEKKRREQGQNGVPSVAPRLIALANQISILAVALLLHAHYQKLICRCVFIARHFSSPPPPSPSFLHHPTFQISGWFTNLRAAVLGESRQQIKRRKQSICVENADASIRGRRGRWVMRINQERPSQPPCLNHIWEALDWWVKSTLQHRHQNARGGKMCWQNGVHPQCHSCFHYRRTSLYSRPAQCDLSRLQPVEKCCSETAHKIKWKRPRNSNFKNLTILMITCKRSVWSWPWIISLIYWAWKQQRERHLKLNSWAKSPNFTSFLHADFISWWPLTKEISAPSSFI